MYCARFASWQKTINKLFSQPTGKFTFDDIITIVGRQRYITYIRKNHPYLIKENGEEALLENRTVYHNEKPVPDSFFYVIYRHIQHFLTRHRLRNLQYIPEILNLYHRTGYKKASSFPATNAMIKFVNLSYPATNFIASTLNDSTGFMFIGKDYLVVSKAIKSQHYVTVIELGTMLKDFILLRNMSESPTLPVIVKPFKAKAKVAHEFFDISEKMPFPHISIRTVDIPKTYFQLGNPIHSISLDVWKILMSDSERWGKLTKTTSH